MIDLTSVKQIFLWYFFAIGKTINVGLNATKKAAKSSQGDAASSKH